MGFGVVFPAERGELEPFACIRDWVGRGNATRPNAGRAASTGRFGLAEPGPSRKSSPGEATPPAESVMLHFPSAPGPAPHPPSGSRGCESWARAPGEREEGKGGTASPPPFRAALPSHTHHAPAPSRRQTGPGLPGVTPALPLLPVLQGPGRAGRQRQGHLCTHQAKKRQKLWMEAAVPQGMCQHSRDREVPHL